MFTGIWLYIFLFSSAISTNKLRSISFYSYSIWTCSVKSNGFSLGKFWIIFLNSFIWSCIVLFSSPLSNTVSFSFSTLFTAIFSILLKHSISERDNYNFYFFAFYDVLPFYFLSISSSISSGSSRFFCILISIFLVFFIKILGFIYFLKSLRYEK